MFQRIWPVLLAICALPASAATTYYVGNAQEAAFNADLLTAGLTASGVINYGANTGFAGASFSQDDTGFAGVGGSLTIPGTALQHATGGMNTGATITPGATTYAIGFHLQTVGSGATACLVDCGNTLSLVSTSTQFFGIISTSPITSFTITTLGGRLQINDFQLGTFSESGSEVPEPSTFALLGGALVALPVLARRRRRG